MTATGLVEAIPPPAITGAWSQHEYGHAVDSGGAPLPLRAFVVQGRRPRYRDQVSPLRDHQSLQGHDPRTGTPQSVVEGYFRCSLTRSTAPLSRGYREMPAAVRGLALCAGAGGLELGIGLAERRYRTIAYVEREPAAVAVLKARMRDGCLHRAPVFDDLRTFKGRPWRGRVDILSAGYPCQPFSTCGDRKGFADERNLWPHVARIIGEVRPARVCLENVSAHLSLGFPLVAWDLRRLGYRFAAGVFSAGEVGAKQERQRLFVLADADGLFRRGSGPHAPRERRRHLPARRTATRSMHAAPRSSALVVPDFAPGPLDFQAWRRLLAACPELEPSLERNAPRMAGWMDRQRLAGNGVCSLAAAYAYASLDAALAAGATGELAGDLPVHPMGRAGAR